MREIDASQCAFQYRGYPVFFKDERPARGLPLIYVSEHEARGVNQPLEPFRGSWFLQPASFSSILAHPIFSLNQQLRREALETLIAPTAWILNGWKVLSLFLNLDDELAGCVRTVVFDMRLMLPFDPLDVFLRRSRNPAETCPGLQSHVEERGKQAWQKLCRIKDLRHLELIVTNRVLDTDEFQWEEVQCPEGVRDEWPFSDLFQLKSLRTLTLRGRCTAEYDTDSASYRVPSRTIERLVRLAKWLGATAALLEEMSGGLEPDLRTVYLASERLEVVEVPLTFYNYDMLEGQYTPLPRRPRRKRRKVPYRKRVLRRCCRPMRIVLEPVKRIIASILTCSRSDSASTLSTVSTDWTEA